MPAAGRRTGETSGPIKELALGGGASVPKQLAPELAKACTIECLNIADNESAEGAIRRGAEKLSQVAVSHSCH